MRPRDFPAIGDYTHNALQPAFGTSWSNGIERAVAEYRVIPGLLPGLPSNQDSYSLLHLICLDMRGYLAGRETAGNTGKQLGKTRAPRAKLVFQARKGPGPEMRCAGVFAGVLARQRNKAILTRKIS